MVKLPHDIDGLIVIHSFPWVLLVGVLAIIAVIGCVIWWWRRKRNRGKALAVDVLGDLLTRLSALAAAPIASADAKSLATQLSDAARQLIEYDGVLNATSMTTEELVSKFRSNNGVKGDDTDTLSRVLRATDRVKYAGFPLEGDAFLRDVSAVKALVQKRADARRQDAADGI